MKIIANKKQTLLDVLKEAFPDSSNRTLKNWILNRRVQIDKECITKPHQIINKGSILYLTAPKKQLYPQLEIVFETPNYLVISKPANLLTVPLDNKPEKNIFEILKNNYPTQKILPIHRLDREVSGLVLFAKNKHTQLSFKKLFEMREINKFYLALVENHLNEKKGVFNSPLKELKSLHVIADPFGKEAITHYKIIDENTNYSTLLLNPKTGRKHQLRVHCANANHPILGDVRYNSNKKFHKRIALHALYLAFIDPTTHEKKEFFSNPPSEFRLKNQKNIYLSIKEELK